MQILARSSALRGQTRFLYDRAQPKLFIRGARPHYISCALSSIIEFVADVAFFRHIGIDITKIKH